MGLYCLGCDAPWSGGEVAAAVGAEPAVEYASTDLAWEYAFAAIADRYSGAAISDRFNGAENSDRFHGTAAAAENPDGPMCTQVSAVDPTVAITSAAGCIVIGLGSFQCQ